MNNVFMMVAIDGWFACFKVTGRMGGLATALFSSSSPLSEVSPWWWPQLGGALGALVGEGGSGVVWRGVGGGRALSVVGPVS